MSKVALSGNASGTGTFTIASPNSNTDRTLSLPDAAGTVAVTGGQPSFVSTIGVGNATPSGSGSGITFPATQSASSDANTLDDYEEGTWSPNIGGNATYLNQFGRYTKVGNKVFVEGFVEINVLGTGATGNISGLPFSSNSANPLGVASVGFFANAAGSVSFLSATISTNSTQLSMRHVSPGGSTGMGATNFFTNGTALFFTANYSV